MGIEPVGHGGPPWVGAGAEGVRRTITPEDIEEATFRIAPLGYRRKDVDALLQAVVDDLRASSTQRADPRDELPIVDLALSLDAAECIRRDAERDARAIVQTATEAAQAILISARRSYEDAERKANELLELAQARTREIASRALDCQRVLLELADAVGKPIDPELSGRLTSATDLLNDDTRALLTESQPAGSKEASEAD